MKINQPAALAYYEAANHGTEDFPLAYYPNLVSVWREFFLCHIGIKKSKFYVSIKDS